MYTVKNLNEQTPKILWQTSWTEIAGFNHDDFNHWFRSQLKSDDFCHKIIAVCIFLPPLYTKNLLNTSTCTVWNCSIFLFIHMSMYLREKALYSEHIKQYCQSESCSLWVLFSAITWRSICLFSHCCTQCLSSAYCPHSDTHHFKHRNCSSLLCSIFQNVAFSDWFHWFSNLHRKTSSVALSVLIVLEILSKCIHVGSCCLPNYGKTEFCC